jgi:hypothetical protein
MTHRIVGSGEPRTNLCASKDGPWVVGWFWISGLVVQSFAQTCAFVNEKHLSA